MELEPRLLEAIDQLVAEGDTAAIACLAAFLACDGKVGILSSGLQYPFRDFLERDAVRGKAVEDLVRRGILVRSRRGLILNTEMMSRNKAKATSRCARRLFARAWRHFAPVLDAVHFDDLRDLCRRQSVAALNRAHRHMGARYWELHRLGLLVTSNRTTPRLFPTLSFVSDVPEAAAIALTLDQGRALTAANMANNVGVVYQVALAVGCLADDGSVTLTDRGRTLATAYVADAIRRRLRWIGGCRDEAMHFLVDELLAPLPAVWIDGTPTQVSRIQQVEEEAPLRVLFHDRQLRAWMRRLVRRLTAIGVARKIACRDGVDRYYFAPGVAEVAKATLGLPDERFVVPKKLARRSWDAIAEFLTTLPEPEPEVEAEVKPALTYLESLLR